jgi:hypothetical protein
MGKKNDLEQTKMSEAEVKSRKACGAPKGNVKNGLGAVLTHSVV